MVLAGAAFVMALWMLAGQANVFAPVIRPDSRPITPRGDLAPLEQTFVAIFERTSPSVAHITTRSLVRDGWGGASTQEGTGSGFVWDERGTIVTNFHVVSGAQRVRVAIGDRTYSAQVVNGSPDHDLAVLRIQGDYSGLAPIRIGSSKDLKVGQTAIAIGNPFGFDQTMTTGIISALNRSIATKESKQLSGLIQVDAAINPGNSGGPLLDSEGRLIGVTTAIYSPSGASVGIGFAVPVDTVNDIVPQLLGAANSVEDQLAAKPVIGVTNDSQYRSCPVEVNGFRHGAIFTEVRPGFGAHAAGLRPFVFDDRGMPQTWGDVIVAIDNARVRTFDELGTALRGKKGGDTVSVIVVRGMPDAPKLETVRVQLGKTKS